MQTPKTDGADAPGSETEKQSTEWLQDNTHWRNSYGLTGIVKRTSQKLSCLHAQKGLFPINPRGECVIMIILPDPFIIKVMNLPLILHMLWPFIEEDLSELKSTIVLSRKGIIGVTMPALGKEHNIWTGRCLKLRKLSAKIWGFPISYGTLIYR